MLKKIPGDRVLNSYIGGVLILAALALTTGPLKASGGEIIQKIILEGNRKVSTDTVRFYMKSREKGYYSVTALRKDFHSLWETGFFQDISIESKDGTQGKIVTINVKENPLIASVTFKTGKKIKESDIVDRLQQNNILFSAFSYYNPAKLKKAQRVIKEFLLDKGYSQGRADIGVKDDPAKNQVTLTVDVIRGPKTRIGEVVFTGLDTKKVSAGFLRRGMKNNQTHSILSMLGSKDVYNREKIDEDLEEVKLRLMQKGFLEAKVGTPSVSMIKKASVTGRGQKMMRIEIPVKSGPQYRVGDIKLEGNTVVKTQFLNRLVTLQKGDIYDIKKRNRIRESIVEIYGSLGYIFCQVLPQENLDPIKKTADLTLRLQEGDVAYLGKLEFRGNTFTRDAVLRREWLLQEGRRLNLSALKNCITRMQQLGLVAIEKAPDFKPDPEDPTRMNIDVEVKEVNRQSVNFQLGYSGYEGLYGTLGYSTKNFMGRGETLGLTLQYGSQSKQYRISFMEPYFMNLPVNLGFSIYKTSLDYPDLYTVAEEGISLTASGRIYRFLSGSLTYTFKNVKASDISDSLLASNPLLAVNYQQGLVSSIAPSLYYSTVDSPIFPSSGTKVLLRYTLAGGVLGGETDYHKTRFQFLKLVRPWKKLRHSLGVQLVAESLVPFGEGTLPLYTRIFLGGENSIRGFEIYNIGPRNEDGYVTGGNKAFHINLEYNIPFNNERSISASLFYDIGNAYDFGEPISLKNVYSSMGMEFKIFVPMLNVPFRLIFAYNPRTLEPGDSHFTFRFAVGPSFQ